uniref:DDE-1 domain-containing protein n=1 Tax=Peronospora matthiolae TaxID=2874970 RepID=A0AAV1TFJ2_9STRA
MGALEEALPHLKAVVAGYAPRDVYNMDETGLFYSMTPDKTIAQQEVEGFKKDKTRITVALTANADGSDKLPPFFIDTPKSRGVLSTRQLSDCAFSTATTRKPDDWHTLPGMAGRCRQKYEGNLGHALNIIVVVQ